MKKRALLFGFVAIFPAVASAITIDPEILGFSKEVRKWVRKHDSELIAKKIEARKNGLDPSLVTLDKERGRGDFALYKYQKMHYDQPARKRTKSYRQGIKNEIDPFIRLNLTPDKRAVLNLLLQSYKEEPTNTGIILEIANLFFGENHTPAAIYWNKKALKIDGKNTKAHWNLAVIYSSLKDVPSASSHFNKFLTLEPKGFFANRAREYLITNRSFDEDSSISKLTSEMTSSRESAPAIITTWGGNASSGESAGSGAYLEVQGEIVDPAELFPQDGEVELGDPTAHTGTRVWTGAYTSKSDNKADSQ